jgi:hypothetical protein
MKTLQRFALIPGVLALLLACAGAAFADPPSRAVRLKYMSGEVSMQPGGVNDWVAAVVNRPLTSADRVWSDKNARAELALGSASLRMNAETSMTFTNVGDEIVQVELDQGTLSLHVRHLFDGETYEIDTPNLAFTILKGGDYRFDVDPNADTTYVTVWHGEGEANGQGKGVKLHSGEQASFGNGTSLEHRTYDAPDRDGFDDWCKVRSEREDHAQSYRYVSADVIGADDLDEYGTWRPAGAYGTVWVPAVAPGWAPYHYGHWVWVEPWGWTWVDDEPWGFAPCHYGRWVFWGGAWAWAPGPVVVARPVYAPALVAWVGGAHWGVSVSFGGGAGVGWFPLGYGEPYVPAYSVSRTYFQQVNVTNTHITNITNVTNNYYVTNNNTTIVRNTNITNIHYANQTVPGALTAVPNRVMTNSEPVARSVVAVNANEVKAAPLAAAPPVAPARSSVLGANAGTRAALPPAQAGARPVFSQAAPPARPVPFEAKQEALARNPGRPLDAQTEAQIRTTIPATPMHAAGQPGVPAAPAQPGRPGTPAAVANPANVPAKPSPIMTNPAPRPGNATPGVNAGATQPAQPARVVPRPPQPGLVQEGGNAGNEGVRPAAGSSHPVITPASGAAPAAPAPVAAPVRNVPRPPQPGTPVNNNNSATTPRQPVRAPDPEGERPAANVPRPNTPPPSNSERVNPSPRAPENTAPAVRQPAHNENARTESQPRASAEPRPQPPRPLYDTHSVHEEQRPQPKSQPQPQTHHDSGHSDHKETH